jgi:hypothetical protein
MLSFREYVGAVGSSLKTVARRNFKKSFPDLLNEHMLLKLDKSGKYVLNAFHSPRINTIIEGVEEFSSVPPLNSNSWKGNRPAIKTNLPSGDIPVRFGVGIPFHYNKEKWVVSDVFLLGDGLLGLHDAVNKAYIVPAKKMIVEARQEIDDAKHLIVPTDEDTLKYGQHFNFLEFDYMYYFYEDPNTYERVHYTGKDLTIQKKKRKKSINDLTSACNNVEKDIKQLQLFLKYIIKKEI